MNRITFLVDGFNLYHSVLDHQKITHQSANWLDIAALLKSYLYLFGKDAILAELYYFSALPEYLKAQHPEKIFRHQTYIRCLESTGIKKELGRFKEKEVYCESCRKYIIKHEEKETDVAIAIKLFELFYLNQCDTAVIVSGDTDLAPAVRKCLTLFPDKKIYFAFPYKRFNKELDLLAPGSFAIKQNQYMKFLLPDPVLLPDGTEIHKPATW